MRLSPAAAARSGVSPSMRRPRNQTSPPVGRMFWVMQLNTVVLPAPFGPMMLWMLLSATARSSAATAVSPPKRIDSAAAGEDRHRSLAGSRSAPSSTVSASSASCSSRRRTSEGHSPSGRQRIITISAAP